jgi:phage shock protein A
MGVMKRMSSILQAKTNKLLDKAEDPRESLDLSYQKQLESLQKVRRSVADVTTAKKRIELQASQLQGQADKLQQQARAALTQGNEDLAREALARQGGPGKGSSTDLETQHAAGGRPGAEAHRHGPEAPGPGRLLPHQEGDDEGHLHGGGGPDQDRRGGLGHLRVDERRRSCPCNGPRTRSHGMQARAGAMDELLASGALTDLANPVDDIQAQLDKASTTSAVDCRTGRPQGRGRRRQPAPGRARTRRTTGRHRHDRPHPGRGPVHESLTREREARSRRWMPR